VAAGIQRRTRRSSLEASLRELASLVEAGGGIVAARVSQILARPSPTYVGSGKLVELAQLVRERCLDLVVCDDELKPSQQRAIENALEIKVIDRTALILDIFATRAKTREGRLQVQLAQSEYLLPRLAGQWAHLERLGGGIGTRGPGEAQIETDRRLVRRQILTIKKQLEQVRLQRSQRRQNRTKNEVQSVSLVGYTNAGKSALFNWLVRGEVTVRDQLFSTLDTTTRGLYLPSGGETTINDTVGFVRKLPPVLVAAFRATLEELNHSDLLIHVVDANNCEAREQIEVVDSVLSQIGLSNMPRILVFNKLDLLDDDVDTGNLYSASRSTIREVKTSAKTGEGVEELRLAIGEAMRPTTDETGVLGDGAN